MRIDIKGTIISNDYAWIYEFLEMDFAAPKNVQKSLDEANGEPVDVYIDSGGGDIFAGSAIYSALRSYPGKVNIHVVGLAASAASVIACAAESDIAPTAMIMVHNVSTRASGDYHAMDKSSETLQKANRAIASAYVEKTGMSEDEALRLMDCETWLTANEAVEKGLIDKISENKTVLVAGLTTIPSIEAVNKLKSMINAERDKAKLQAKINLEKKKGEMKI